MNKKTIRLPKKQSKNNNKFINQQNRKNQPRPDLSDLIKKILLVISLLILALYCIFPLLTLQDIMKYFQTQEFTVCLVLEILLLLAYNFIPQLLPQQTQQSINSSQSIPSLMFYETCDICNKESSLSEIHYVDSFKICSKCIRKGIRRL